jgi:hypothetical protein
VYSPAARFVGSSGFVGSSSDEPVGVVRRFVDVLGDEPTDEPTNASPAGVVRRLCSVLFDKRILISGMARFLLG